MNMFSLKKYRWGCSWQKGITLSNRTSKIFPFDFEVDGFFQKQIDNLHQNTFFYLDVEIPRKGTDTKVFIKPIPLGLKVKSEKNIVLGYEEKDRYSYSYKMFQIREIASKSNGDKSIENLLNNNFRDIQERDKKIIEQAIGTDDSQFKNKEALIACFQELKRGITIYITSTPKLNMTG